MTDWGGLYLANVESVATLVEGLPGDDLHTTVPGTPAWTVRDVLAHLAGAPSDAVTGRMEGAPRPEWTSRHVSERVRLPVAELVDEMRSHEEAIAEESAGTDSPAIVWNIAVHHADLREALGLSMLPEPLWRPVLDAAAPMMLGRIGGPVDLDVLDVPPYELFRALFSRRSRAQMAAWGLPLTREQLDGLCMFGPRQDDQPVPA